jgi:hypothetical protein
MSAILFHTFVNPKADGGDATVVRPSDWNDGLAASGGANGNLIIRDTSDATYGMAWSTSLTYTSGVLANAHASAALALGATPATAGAIRLTNNTFVYARDAANTTNHPLIGLNSSDDLVIAGTLAAGKVVSIQSRVAVSSVGPHAIGGVTSVDAQWIQRGTFTPVSNGVLFDLQSTMNVAAGLQGVGMLLQPTFAEAASGAHPLLASLYVGGAVTGGVATVTDTATIYVANALAATVTGKNYSIWVDSGLNRFDGDGTHVFELPTNAVDPTGGGGAAVGRIPCSIGGVTRYIPYY